MRFVSERYPQLRLSLSGRGAVVFVDGACETEDEGAIAALSSLPAEYGVRCVDKPESKSAPKPAAKKSAGRPPKKAGQGKGSASS